MSCYTHQSNDRITINPLSDRNVVFRCEQNAERETRKNGGESQPLILRISRIKNKQIHLDSMTIRLTYTQVAGKSKFISESCAWSAFDFAAARRRPNITLKLCLNAIRQTCYRLRLLVAGLLFVEYRIKNIRAPDDRQNYYRTHFFFIRFWHTCHYLLITIQ